MRPVPLGDKEQRDVAAAEARIGPDVVGERRELFVALAAREDGHRVAVAAQQRRDAAEAAAEVAVGIVAAGGDDAVDLPSPVVLLDSHPGLNLPQQRADILHQRAVLGRRLDQTAVAARHDAEQVEEADQRDVAGHDHQHAAGPPDRDSLVAREPPRKQPGVEHPAHDGPYGPPDVAGRKPASSSLKPRRRRPSSAKSSIVRFMKTKIRVRGGNSTPDERIFSHPH